MSLIVIIVTVSLYPLDPPSVAKLIWLWERVEEWTGSDATTEEITGICIPPDRDGGMRPRRRRRLSASRRPLGLCLRDGLLTSIHFRAYQSACPPTGPSFLPVFIAVSKSVFLPQQILFLFATYAENSARVRPIYTILLADICLSSYICFNWYLLSDICPYDFFFFFYKRFCDRLGEVSRRINV